MWYFESSAQADQWQFLPVLPIKSHGRTEVTNKFRQEMENNINNAE